MNKLKDTNNKILRQLNIDDSLLPTYSFSNLGELNSMVDFDKIVQKEILKYAQEGRFNYKKLNQILIALALDSEVGQVGLLIENYFKERYLLDIILVGLAHPWKEVRWQILEILGRSKNKNKASILFYALTKEKHTYNLRVGLKILSEVNLTLAKVIAEEHLTSEDSYLRIISTDINQLPY